MKLDQKTLTVLKSFSSINPSILFKQGNEIATVSPQKTILAKARIDQTFENRFAIYDLSRFLGIYSLFANPEIELGATSLSMKTEDRQVEYRFTDESNIVVPPEKDINLGAIDIQFNLTEAMISDIQKASGVLSSPEIAIKGDGKRLWLSTFNTKDKDSDTYKINLGETESNFKFVFKGENLRLIPQAYVVSATRKGIANFKGSTVVDVDYWITMEAKASSFD